MLQAQETNEAEKLNKQLKQMQESFEKQQQEMRESFERMLREQQTQIDALKRQLDASKTNAPPKTEEQKQMEEKLAAELGATNAPSGLRGPEPSQSWSPPRQSPSPALVRPT